MIIVTLSCIFFVIKQHWCTNITGLPQQNVWKDLSYLQQNSGKINHHKTTTEINFIRRLFFESLRKHKGAKMDGYEDESNKNLKQKMATLVEQSVHDTERKIKSIQHIRSKYREGAPYRAGFIMSLTKKNKDIMNELFNVAVKHKDEWSAQEHLKIFELIVRTNVDITNLVRHLVETHVQYMNSTRTDHRRRRVLLLDHHKPNQ
ncbi:hypothetical protein ACJJTC_003668 [Scirpophaga incertulas]